MLLWEGGMPDPDEYPRRERDPMHTITYDPAGGHRCTECVDALLPDDPGAYVGRHRRDMPAAPEIPVPRRSSHSWWSWLAGRQPHVAALGTFLPAVVFRVETHDHDAGPRHAELAPAWR